MNSPLNTSLELLAHNVPDVLKLPIKNCYSSCALDEIAAVFLLGPLKAAIKLKLEPSILSQLCEVTGECIQTLHRSSNFLDVQKINRNVYHFFVESLSFANSKDAVSIGVNLEKSAGLFKHFCDYLSISLGTNSVQEDYLNEYSSVVDNLSRLSWNLAITINNISKSSDLAVLLYMSSFRLRCLSPKNDYRNLLNYVLPIYQFYKNDVLKLISFFNDAFCELLISCAQCYHLLNNALPIDCILEFVVAWVDLCFKHNQKANELQKCLVHCEQVFFQKLSIDSSSNCFDFAKTIWTVLNMSIKFPNNVTFEEKDVECWASVLHSETNSSICFENISFKLASYISKWFVNLSNVIKATTGQNLLKYQRTFTLLPLVQWAMNIFEVKFTENSTKKSELPVLLFRGYAYCFYYIIKESIGNMSQSLVSAHVTYFHSQLQSDVFPLKKKIFEVQNVLGNIALLLAEQGILPDSTFLDFLITIIRNHTQLYGLEQLDLSDATVAVPKMYGHLALSYRHLGMYSAGLQSLAQMLILVHGSAQGELLKKWLQLKRFIYNTPSQIELRNMSVVQQVNHLHYPFSEYDTIQLLNAELSFFRKNGSGLEEEMFSITSNIISLSIKKDINRAMAVVDHCRLSRIFSWKTKWDIDKLCQEAIEILEYQIPHDLCCSPASKLYLSFAYFELHLQKSAKLKNCIKESGVSRLKTTWVKPIPKGDEEPTTSCDIEASLQYVTLESGTECLQPLEKSLGALKESNEYARSLGKKWNWDKDCMELKYIIGHICVLAETFLIAQRVEQCVCCLIQLYNLGVSLNDKEVQCQSVCRLVSVLARVGLTQVAHVLIPAMDSTNPALKMECSLASAEAFYYSGEIEKSFDILLSVLDQLKLLQDQSQSRRLLIFEVQAHYLLVRLHMLSISSHLFLSSKTTPKDKTLSEKVISLLRQPPITTALDALKMCIKLYKSQQDTIGYDIWDTIWKSFTHKLCLEQLLLEGALLAGQLYTHQGELSEPRHVLLEYLAIAQEHAAMMWSSEFLICLAELDLLSQNPEDCIVKCHGLFYLLNHKESFSDSNLNSKEKIATPVPDFLDEDPENYPEIDTSPGEIMTENRNFASPLQLKQRNPKSKSFHKMECACAHCKYMNAHLHVFHAVKLQAQCMAYSGDIQSCLESLTFLYDEVKNLLLKSAYKLQQLSLLVAQLADFINIKKSDLLCTKGLDQLVDIRLLDFVMHLNLSLGDCFMQMNNPHKAVFYFEQGLSEMKKNGGFSINLLPFVYSSLLFQRSLANLHILALKSGKTYFSLFRTTLAREPEESMTEIIEGLEVIKISESNAMNFSPVNMNALSVNFKVPNAPIRKGRLALGSNNESHSVSDSLDFACQSIENSNTENKGIKGDEEPIVKESPSLICVEDNIFATPKPVISSEFFSAVRRRAIFKDQNDTVKEKESEKKRGGTSQLSNIGVTGKTTESLVSTSVKKKPDPKESSSPISVDIYPFNTNEKTKQHKKIMKPILKVQNKSDSDVKVMPQSNFNDNGAHMSKPSEMCSRSSRRRHVETHNNFMLQSSSGDVQLPHHVVNSSNTRTLRSRGKVSIADKFEPLRNARKLCHRQKENIENLSEPQQFSMNVSPEILRSGRRNVKTHKAHSKIKLLSLACKNEQLKTVDHSANIATAQESNSTTDGNMKIVTENNVGSNMETSPVPSDNTKLVFETVRKDLFEALRLISHHPPSLVFSQVNLLLAMVQHSLEPISKKGLLEVAYHLSESVGLTLRHQSLYYLQKRKSARIEKSDYAKKLSSMKSSDQARENVLSFHPLDGKNISKTMQKSLDLIPEDWTIVQVSGAKVWNSVENMKATETPDLMIGRYCAKSSPILTLVSSDDPQLRRSFLKEFFDIMEKVVINGKEQQPKVWWTHRFALDRRMENLCKAMETVWLGCWKCLFLGQPINKNYGNLLEEACKSLLCRVKLLGLHCKDENILKCFLDGIASRLLDNRQVATGLLYLFGLPCTKQKSVLEIIEGLELEKFPQTQRSPLILILDKMVHQLPWENMPFLRGCPVTRTPSLAFFLSLVTFHSRSNTHSVVLNGVNGDNVFYLLNPSKDLLRTEAFFKNKLAQIPEWKGLSSEIPTKDQILSALVDFDCYLYIGHGSGRVYLNKEILQSYPCRAAVILMGCSSAKLKTVGIYEPSGVVLQYLMAGCPTVLGCLWDVTDKDIDQFTDVIIKNWLLGKSGTHINTAVVEGRQVCRLKHLTGAAPIVYGLPLYKSFVS